MGKRKKKIEKSGNNVYGVRTHVPSQRKKRRYIINNYDLSALLLICGNCTLQNIYARAWPIGNNTSICSWL